MTRPIHLALFLVLALVLSACSGDGSEDSAGIAEVSTETDDTVASVSDDAPETTVAAAADDSDSSSEIDVDTRLRNFEIALGLKGTVELVDENTVRVTFEEGSVAGADPIRACIVGTPFVINEGMTLIVVYPDGEETCE